VSESLDRVIEALAGVSEDEVAAALAAAGVPVRRPSSVPVVRRTPLPGVEGSSRIHTEVEWV
jgi:hypothetical protein